MPRRARLSRAASSFVRRARARALLLMGSAPVGSPPALLPSAGRPCTDVSSARRGAASPGTSRGPSTLSCSSSDLSDHVSEPGRSNDARRPFLQRLLAILGPLPSLGLQLWPFRRRWRTCPTREAGPHASGTRLSRDWRDRECCSAADSTTTTPTPGRALPLSLAASSIAPTELTNYWSGGQFAKCGRRPTLRRAPSRCASPRPTRRRRLRVRRRPRRALRLRHVRRKRNDAQPRRLRPRRAAQQ